MKKLIALTMAVLMALSLCACDVTYDTSAGGAQQNIDDTQKVTDKLTSSQQTPTDIDYSLERYNLIRRSYWVNGQREKANTLVCAVDKPLGYIVLFTEAGGVVGALHRGRKSFQPKQLFKPGLHRGHIREQ